MKTKKRFLSILLSIVLVLGLMPGMSMTAYADNPYTGAAKIVCTGTQKEKAYNGDVYNRSVTKRCTSLPAEFTLKDLVGGFNGKLNDLSITSGSDFSIDAGKQTGTVSDLGTSSFTATAETFSANWIFDMTITVTALETYSVTLHTNDGTISEGKNVTSYVQEMGAALPTSVDITNGDKVFEGWFDNSGLTGNAVTSISTTDTGNKEYWAKWKTPHTHSFNYSATGATITATCGTEGCTLTNSQATLTIEKPTLTTYGETGKSAEATLTGLEAFNTATSKTIAATEIKYVGRDGTTYTENATAPTDAGKYTAKMTVEGKTASVDYEIDKAQPTTPTGLTATYGQTLANVTLPDGWTWADSTQSVGNVVDPAATFKANFAGDDNHNAASNVDVTVTVGKADPTAPTGLTATYGQTLANVTLPDGWTWADSTQSVGNVVDPAATFKANFAGNDNYKAASNVDVTVTVGKANAVAATVTANNRIYDGTEKPLVTVTGEATGGEMQYALGTKDAATQPYTTSIPAGTDAGTYYVWYKLESNDNYNGTEAAPIEVSIAKRSVTLTSATASKTYDATALTDTTVTVTGDGFATGEGATYDVTGTQTQAGESKNTFTYTLNNGTKAANYEITKVEGTLKVEQVDSSGEVTAVSGLVYDGTEKALVDSKVHGGIFMYRLGTDGEWTEEIPEAADFGTYTVYYYIKGDGNHKDNGSETEPMGSVDVTIKCPYSNEWVDGKWYNKNGTQTYKPLGSWKKDGKDWMYADSSGWYAKNRWQKIDFKWYFFDKEGHMLKDAYQKDASGKIWYIGKSGAWDEKAAVTGWKQDSKGWWFGLYGKDYLKNTWKMINGNWYYFKADGYVAQNEFVNGWWCNKNGVQSDPVKYSWHKTSKGWWYGVSGGWYAKNATYTIDGKSYTFDKMGYQK